MPIALSNVRGVDVEVATPEGAAYVRKVIHPPSSPEGIYQGIPDRTDGTILCDEVKGEQNLQLNFSYYTPEVS